MVLSFIKTFFAFVLAIGILSAVHELGHFYVARFFRVKILKFSIGFGFPLITWYDKYGVEFSIRAIPLGGYVKLLDSSVENIPKTDKYMQFETKPIWARSLIVLAGPIANFLLAIFLYWIVFVAGYMSVIPLTGKPPKDSMIDLAGITEKQVIVAVDDNKVSSWEDIGISLMKRLGSKKPVDITVKDYESNLISHHKISLEDKDIVNKDGDLLDRIGMRRYDPLPPVVYKVIPGYPAETAGIIAGDIIISANAIEVDSRADLVNFLKDKAGEDIVFKVKRGDGIINLHIEPKLKLEDGGHEAGVIGVQFEALPWPKEYLRPVKSSFFSGFYLAVDKTIEYIAITYKFIYKMIVGEVSTKQLSGPVTIASYAGESFQYGWQPFLSFLALISISLGALNLLPIPMLDGGYLLYFIAEFFLGRPVPEKLERAGHMLGLLIVSSVMILALSNDISRLL